MEMLELEEIVRLVEKNAKVPDLAAKHRRNKLPLWKGVYCKIACEITGYSLTEIGRAIDVKHSNVIHWRDSIEYAFGPYPRVKRIYWTSFYELEAVDKQRRNLRALEAVAENIVNNMLK